MSLFLIQIRLRGSTNKFYYYTLAPFLEYDFCLQSNNIASKLGSGYLLYVYRCGKNNTKQQSIIKKNVTLMAKYQGQNIWLN